MKRYATAEQLADQYQVHQATVWRWVQRGIFPAPIKLSPGCSRFDVDEIDRRNAERATAPRDVTPAVQASLKSPRRAKVLERRRRKAKAA